MASRCRLLAYQIIRLTRSRNYTLSMIWDGMTITNALSNAWSETSSRAWDGSSGGQPTPSSSCTPLSIDLTSIHHNSASRPIFTLWTRGEKDRHGEILKNHTILIDVQATLRVRDTLNHIIFMFDRKYLSKFPGDEKERHVYMTIGNQSWKIRQIPSTHSVVMVSLVLIPIINCNSAQTLLDEQRHTCRSVLNIELRRVLCPLTFQQNPSARRGYYQDICADDNIRCCKPVIAAFLIDCPEYSDFHHL